jgi:hypothetical protein
MSSAVLYSRILAGCTALNQSLCVCQQPPPGFCHPNLRQQAHGRGCDYLSYFFAKVAVIFKHTNSQATTALDSDCIAVCEQSYGRPKEFRFLAGLELYCSCLKPLKRDNSTVRIGFGGIMQQRAREGQP